MPSNADAAELFRSIADLLDLLGEKFKPEAYRRAARSIESLTEDLAAVAARHELRAIPGVGEAIAEKTEEYLRTGTVQYYERLKREIPAGLVELMRLPGLGPKTARRFWVELGIEGPKELTDAIAAGRLDGVKGFGDKKIDQIRTALAAAKSGGAATRRPLEEVFPVARSLVNALRAGAPADRVELAGSFRRARESVGDLDILVTSKEPTKVFDVFTAQPEVAEVKMRGETKETVLLKGGLQVDLRVVEPDEFGAALQYFTGSKDHNVRLRSLARDRGLKVNEYGVFRGEERVAGATEEEVYASLGLSWIPPELREDRGEIDLAAKGKVPSLVSAGDVHGDLHVHLPADAGTSDAETVVRDARRRNYSFLGVVVAGVDASGTAWALSEELRSHLSASGGLNPRLYFGVETAPGPLPKGLDAVAHDYRILRPSAGTVGPGESEPPGAPSSVPTVIAHVGASETAALLRWVEEARKSSAAFDLGPGPERLDSTGGRLVREAGLSVHLATGVGRPPDDPTGEVALGFARRAGMPPEKVWNVRLPGALSSARSAPRKSPSAGSSDPPRSPSSTRRRSA